MVVRATCKLVSEYYRRETPTHILTQNEKILAMLDETLWNYPVNSFVPHVRASTKQSACIVTMDVEWTSDDHGSVLINLATRVPSCADKFDSICEFLMQHEETKQHARSKFAQYREMYRKPNFVALPDWDNSPILT